MKAMNDKILKWFASGKVGISSKAMACAVIGLPQHGFDKSMPYDPADFNRCLLLLDEVPEIREKFDTIAALSKSWERLILRWDEVEKTFLDEVGLDWVKGNMAHKTYELMKSIRLEN